MLTKNAIIEWNNPSGKSSRDRVLHIDPQKGQTVLINLDDPKSMPQWVETECLETDLENRVARILSHDPWSGKRGLLESEILETHKGRRDHNWDQIKDVVGDPAIAFDQKARFKAIRRTGLSDNQAYTLLKKYWQGGQTKNTLLPDYKGRKKAAGKDMVGRKGRTAITKTVEEKFEEAVRRFYETKEANTLQRAYEMMVAHLFTPIQGPGKTPEDALKDVPTFRQFQYWMKTRRNSEKATKKRMGQTKFAMNKRPLLDTANAGITGPGAVFQIDSTIADVHLVSVTDRTKIVGKPTLFLVSDVFSRLITGFSLSLTGATYLQSALAILNCTENKVAFAAEHGLEILPEDWPCHHLPECITADRGELEGPVATTIVEGLNIRLDNTPPFRADMKGVIESKFQNANLGLIHWLPGGVKRAPSRGDELPQTKATLNIREFTQLIILWILEHNRSIVQKYPLETEMIRDGVKPIPNKIWEWGIQNRSGGLRQENPSVVLSHLLPRKEASVTRRGIHFQGVHYTCKTAEAENWFFKAGDSGAWKVKIAIDSRNCGNTYIQHGNGELEACQLTARSKEMDHLSWEEVAELRRIAKSLEKQASDETLVNRVDFHKNVDAIVTKAKLEKGEITQKPAKKGKVSEARRAELEELAKANLPQPPSAPKLAVLPPVEEDEYIANPDMLDELKKLRNPSK